MPVITADAFGDFFAAGDGAGEPDRAHDGLGAAVDESQHLDGGNRRDDFLRQLRFQFRRRGETRPAPQRLADGRDDALVGVADNERPVAGDKVDIRIPVQIGDAAP